MSDDEIARFLNNFKIIVWDDLRMRVIIILLTLGSIIGVIDSDTNDYYFLLGGNIQEYQNK